jgi:hypothetical protein
MLTSATILTPPWDRPDFQRGVIAVAIGWSGGLSIAENREAGIVGESFIERLFGPGKAGRSTTDGMRFLDNLTADGVARESKVGKTFLTRRIRRQIAKDVELMNTPGSGVTAVQWHFQAGVTGIGPSSALRKALVEAGISIIEHR